jgi:acetyl esterase/lipase
MKHILILLLLTGSLSSNAQEKMPLYPNLKNIKIGGAKKIEDAPYLLYYKGGGRSGKPAILICPGGGYTALAMDHEGKDVAAFFNKNGFDAFVLAYRLNDQQQTGSIYPAQYNDVITAIRLIKYRAPDWKIDPEKVGIIGFSAGGHLASMCATIIDNGNTSSPDPTTRLSSRPAFAILIYPVISFIDTFSHQYSGEMLLGKDATLWMKDSLSTYRRVSSQTPPTFLVYSNDDKDVPPENGIAFYQALRRKKIPASLLIYDHGGHGYGMAPKDPVLNTWPGLAVKWLEGMGMK